MKTITRALIVLAMAAGIGVAVAAPAQASYGECNSGYVCVWYNINGGGTRVELFNNPGTCVTFLGQVWDNQIDSFRNSLWQGRHVQFYDGNNCNGQLLWRDSVWMNGGPFAVGVQDNFEYNAPRGGPLTNHRNKASSAWFNNG